MVLVTSAVYSLSTPELHTSSGARVSLHPDLSPAAIFSRTVCSDTDMHRHTGLWQSVNLHTNCQINEIASEHCERTFSEFGGKLDSSSNIQG